MMMTDDLMKEFNARNLTLDMQISLLRSANDVPMNVSSPPRSVKARNLQTHNEGIKKINDLKVSLSNSKLTHVRRICRQDLKKENDDISSSEDSDSSASMDSSTTIRMNRKRREMVRRSLVKERSSSFNTNDVCYNTHYYGRVFSPSIPEGMVIHFDDGEDGSVSSVSCCCCEETEDFTYFDGTFVESFLES